MEIKATDLQHTDVFKQMSTATKIIEDSNSNERAKTDAKVQREKLNNQLAAISKANQVNQWTRFKLLEKIREESPQQTQQKCQTVQAQNTQYAGMIISENSSLECCIFIKNDSITYQDRVHNGCYHYKNSSSIELAEKLQGSFDILQKENQNPCAYVGYSTDTIKQLPVAHEPEADQSRTSGAGSAHR